MAKKGIFSKRENLVRGGDKLFSFPDTGLSGPQPKPEHLPSGANLLVGSEKKGAEGVNWSQRGVQSSTPARQRKMKLRPITFGRTPELDTFGVEGFDLV